MMRMSTFTGCTALITGASAGIGYEVARQLAPMASTMVLVARRNYRLETLEWELKAINPELKLFSRALDLRDQGELERFCDWLDGSDLTIDLLVNNAGLGDHGPFIDSEWERVNAMLQVNVYALTYLTFRVLPAMRKTGHAAILNVSSIASLLPMPNSAVYAATKAYVTSFSEAIRAELRCSHVSVTVLCPGPVPTEFLGLATRRDDQERHTAPESFVVPVDEVVRQALRAVAKRRARVIPGTIVNLAMTAVAFLPMFVKRLVYDVQMKRQQRGARSSSANYEKIETV
jgi:Short-chain dehydrogenases of various substrate specificities